MTIEQFLLKQEHQSKLLRFLDDGSYKTVGGNKTLRSDARIIAATNKDLSWGIGQMGKLNNEEVAEVGRRLKKHNKQADNWRRINDKTKSLGVALSHVARNDPDINLRKCVEAYEIITLETKYRNDSFFNQQ